MADNRSIVITLKLDNSGANENDVSGEVNGTKVANNNDKDSTSKAIAVFAVAQVVQTTVNELVNWGEYYWNRELMLDDDYIGQRNKQVALTHINRAIGTVSSIASATSSGAAIGGVPGAIIGFIVGTATQTAGIIRSNVQGQDQQTIMLRQMDAQLQFTRSRAGWSTKAASIGEDL